MNENPEKFNPFKADDELKAANEKIRQANTVKKDKPIGDFEKTMIISRTIEKEKEKEVMDQLNKVYEGNSKIVAETTPEMEVPKPPEKFNPLAGGKENNKNF